VTTSNTGSRWETMAVQDAPRRGASLAEQAHQTLRNWVITGALEPGVVLSENDLARRFSISRAPLREAVRRLQEEGLLNASGPRGFTVPPLSVDMVRQVYGVRHALEVAAASTASGIEAGDVAKMRARMQDARVAMEHGDLARFTHSDFEFHDMFILRCGNPMLISHIARIRGHVERIINFAGTLDAHNERSLEEHLVILDAMETGRSDPLSDAVSDHIRGVTDRLVEQLSRPGQA
jgi:GntR family transcriptional regulator, rspAB operon transcriptional repressor